MVIGFICDVVSIIKRYFYAVHIDDDANDMLCIPTKQTI